MPLMLVVDVGPQRCPPALSELILLWVHQAWLWTAPSSRTHWCQDGAWDTGNAQMRAWFTPPGESVPTEWYPWPLSSVLKGAVDFER